MFLSTNLQTTGFITGNVHNLHFEELLASEDGQCLLQDSLTLFQRTNFTCRWCQLAVLDQHTQFFEHSIFFLKKNVVDNLRVSKPGRYFYPYSSGLAKNRLIWYLWISMGQWESKILHWLRIQNQTIPAKVVYSCLRRLRDILPVLKYWPET